MKSNEEIIDQIRKDGDPERKLLLDLWERNAGMIRNASKRFDSYIEPDDMLQECYIAFHNAVKDYDPAAGFTFITHLKNAVVWHLSRYVKECGAMIRIPDYQRQQIRRYRKYCRQYYQSHGEEPSDDLIRRALGLSKKQLDQLRADSLCSTMASLDKPIFSDGDEDLFLMDTVMDPAADVEMDVSESVFSQERRRAVWDAVDSLDKPLEATAIRAYYQAGKTYKQIGEAAGISGNMVRNRIASGIRKLRTGKRYRVLRDFVDLSPEYSKGLQGGMNSFNRTWTSSTEQTALWMLEREEDLRRLKEELQELRAMAARS